MSFFCIFLFVDQIAYNFERLNIVCLVWSVAVFCNANESDT